MPQYPPNIIDQDARVARKSPTLLDGRGVSDIGFSNVGYDPSEDVPMPYGPCWMTVGASSALVHPGGGWGEVVATDEASLIAADLYTWIDGIVIDDLPAVAATLDIRTADDVSSIYSINIPTSGTPLPHVVKFPEPLLVFVPWGVKCSQTDMRIRVHFRRRNG